MIIRVIKDASNNYVMLNKEFINNDMLSLKAKGLLTYLLSLPNDWQIYENELMNHSTDGRDSIRTAIKELINNGYIERERTRNEKGELKGYSYVVYEKTRDFTYVGKSNIGKPNIGKSNTTNNNNNNNKKEKCKREKYFDNEEVNSLFLDFLKMRVKMKAINSERAINNLLNTLNKHDDKTKIQMINNSITNSWKGIFDIKPKEQPRTDTFSTEGRRMFDDEYFKTH